ncbi:PglD-related sugar-binding protein [Gordoniibacillus kamchatkensis]|uniref:PglD-related sugar-binding protein n=1 Tax=Gordoniibacillus kamchatkensis TaxID=1590651 RepID=UPI000697F2C9|nr:hypothetical protein [Paenibacillus sp. VKM B-2647]
MDKLIIIGAGGHGRVVSNIAERQFPEIEQIFVDDKTVGTEVRGKRVASTIREIRSILQTLPGQVGIVVAIGHNDTRKIIAGMIEPIVLSERRFHYATIIDPSAVISPDAQIGYGTVIMPNTTISSQANIGSHCIINNNSSIDHDCEIGDFCHISPGVHLTGCKKIRGGTLL